MLRRGSRLLTASATAGAAAVLVLAPAAAARVREGHANAARLSRAVAAANGGAIRADTGETVNVTTSPAYGANSSQLLQRWANFMAHLQHGPELRRMTVYVAPLAEVMRICGQGFDGCYSTDPARLTVPGDGADQRYIDLIATHEYGHHVDASRRNDPWDASTWGPKYWATYENVCHRVRIGTAFPGNEGAHYRLNPDEAWAESYAVLNGYAWESQYFDDSFKPDAGALREMRYDIHNPWTGPAVHRYGGSRRTVKLPEPADGNLDATLRTDGAADLSLYSRGKLLKRVRARGSTTRLRYTICGQYPLELRVARRRGSGRYRMTVVEP